MNREEATTRLLILRGLADLVAAEITRTRQVAAELFTRPGQREVGELHGQPIGNVRLDKGTSTWGVVDPDAFLGWVRANRPDEVVVTERVRPAYQAAVLKHLQVEDALLDRDTGELEVPDGVAPKHGKPTLKVTPVAETNGVVLAALGDAAAVLGLAGPPELVP